MTIALGLNAEIALAEEVTYGSSVGIGSKQYFDAVSETLSLENPNVTSNRLRGGRLPTAADLVKGGRKRVSGNVELEVQAQSIGWFLKHLMGGYAVSGAGPYVHVFTLDDLPVGLHLFVKRDIDTFAYKGCRVTTAEFSVSDQMLKCTMGFMGQDATTGATFGASSYPASNELFSFAECVLEVDGSAADVREVSITFDNQLFELPKIGSRLNRQPAEGRANITGRIRKEYEDGAAYTKFVDGTDASLVLTATGSGGSILEFSFATIFYTGGTPNASSPEPIAQELPFEVRDDGTANGGITATLTNTTATYA